jgi:hypothetical protein
MTDERIKVCSTCDRRVADIGEVSDETCQDPAACRERENKTRRANLVGPLINALYWYYSPYEIGPTSDETRASLRHQQRWIERYSKLESDMCKLEAQVILWRIVALG